MALTAESALPLQNETTDRKKKPMPVGKYFQGEGEKVMSNMKERYGPDKGERVFYATANKRHQKPEDNKNPKSTKRKSVGQMIAEG